MSPAAIHFFQEDISFNLKQKIRLRNWISNTIKEENKRIGELSFIFCSDAYLLSINQEYLNHNTYTDIITFDNSENDHITGDIFISLDRVRENAFVFKVSEHDELHRVMIHGALHLLGYIDKGKDAKALMTSKENYYLLKRF